MMMLMMVVIGRHRLIESYCQYVHCVSERANLNASNIACQQYVMEIYVTYQVMKVNIL